MSYAILFIAPESKELDELIGAFQMAAGERAKIEVFENESDLVARMDSGFAYDLIIIDYAIGDGKRNGSQILKVIRARDELVPIIAVAQTGDVHTADRAVKDGASDFLVRSGELEKRVSTLFGKVSNLLALIEKNRILGEQNQLLAEAHRSKYRILGESAQIFEIIRRIERVASIPRPVLVTGERGTGKELVARAIHEARVDSRLKPFVAVNCAALSDTLLETELFGHEKGAFTGADRVAFGKFEQADDGTLFLDEIGNMSLQFQKKILRVVEYGVFNRVGGRKEIRTKARIIAATNADLEAKMHDGHFLRDLYDRLAFEIIRVPPLREREGDIERLARHFLEEFLKEVPALGAKRLAPESIRALRGYRFPGNVRELKNIIERAAYRDTTSEITPEDIGMLGDPDTVFDIPGNNFEEKVESFKKTLILGALDNADNNQAKAARTLGLSYHQFRYFYRKYASFL